MRSASILRAATAVSVAAATTVVGLVPNSAVAAWDDSPTGPGTRQVIINELFVDPDAVPDSRGEFVELHNPTGAPVSLAGWTIGDEQYDRYEIRDVTIGPGGFAVLARFGPFERNGGIVADEVYGDHLVLLNRGDRVILRDAAGALVDVVDYSTGEWPVVPGRSMALRDPGLDGRDPGSWCLSTTTLRNGDFASPGRGNVCEPSPYRLVFSEVLFNPRATSDFVGEWFEIANVGDSPVDLIGFTIQDERGESFRVERSLVVAPGARVVFGITDDREVNGDVAVDYAYGDAMRLFDTFDELILNDPDGVLVDRVAWDDGDTFPDPNGASIVRADLSADGSDGSNWCVATTRWANGDFGSPGRPGGCGADGTPEVVITEIMFDPARSESTRDGQWLELTNVGDEPAVLDGFGLRTLVAGHLIDSLTIEPGGVVVLAANGDPSRNGGVQPDYVYGTSFGLTKIAPRVELVSPDGHVVDGVRWTRGRGFPRERGHSIQLRSTEADNSLGANWCLADEPFGDGDFGTPGRLGSCPEPDPIQPLRITEVMRRPTVVPEPLGEWIEIHNPTDRPVDLWNWAISDDGSDHFRVPGPAILPAGGYLVVARHGDPAANGGVDAGLVAGATMMLANDRDRVVLTDPYGREVDRVAWSPGDDMPSVRGSSMSLAPDGTSWCATATQYGAGDRGTPGAPNDCAPFERGPVIVNEIHRDPQALVDSRGEWLELYNRSSSPVDISGWTIQDDRFSTFTFDPSTPLVIQPGGFLVAARNGPALNGGIAVDVIYGVEVHHRNHADDVTLLDRDRRVVDRVAWTESNGFPLVPGASMALRHPDLDGSVGANWCASVTDQGNGDLGTPGAPNVCELTDDPPPDPPASPAVTSHVVFAHGAADCAAPFAIDASSVLIDGAVRANGDVDIRASTITLDGTVSHGGTAAFGRRPKGSGVVLHEPDRQQPPIGWTTEEFAPGGRWWERFASELHVHPGDLVIEGSSHAALAPGIHVVDGDVRIGTNQTVLDGITIIATGTISIRSTTVKLSRVHPDLPLLLAAGGSCSTPAVDIEASAAWLDGAVVAPSGELRLSASMLTTAGPLLGSSVDVSGHRIVLGRSAP